jgi:farnesyl diphosphate synthase
MTKMSSVLPDGVGHEDAHQDFLAWVQTRQTQAEETLSQVLPDEHLAPQTLHRAMRYSALGGGKRVRALLCYAAAEFCHTKNAIADVAAAALEMIHAYSLVHDDMPCMDDDDLRRGKPSCHKQFDDATALLVGDSLQTLAFDILSKPLAITPDKQLQMVNLLARASGAAGMAGGQAIDLSSVGKALNQTELAYMHQLKTGALIEAAVLLGAIAGTDAQIAAVKDFALHIGLAFQVVDDILDVEADSATLGKTAGKDAAKSKPTYVSILGLAAAKQHAHFLYQSALNALAPFGEEATRLRQLADFIMHRSF